MNILVIEDDPQMAKYIARRLESLKHRVELAPDGAEGLFRAAAGQWDLLIIDRGLPGIDGISLVDTLRRRDRDTPILFLTGMNTLEDRVQGLEAGADDYLAKPFEFAELKARVEALGRRRRVSQQTTLRVADLEMDLIARKVERGGREIELQHREFQLLEALMRHAGQVVTREELLETVWGMHIESTTNAIQTHISRLRAKVDAGFEYELIHTVRHTGYTLRPPTS